MDFLITLRKISLKANLFTVHALVSFYIIFQRFVTHIFVLEGNSRIIWSNSNKCGDKDVVIIVREGYLVTKLIFITGQLFITVPVSWNN